MIASSKDYNKFSLMLTGGRDAKKLYSLLAKQSFTKTIPGPIDIFFTDERCVPPDHADSNYRMVNQTLFPYGIPEGTFVHRMHGEAKNLNIEAERYSNLLPESIDLLLLSLGDDGHIASLFPHSGALREKDRRIVPVYESNVKYSRLSITPVVIQKAKNVYVLALDEIKYSIYKKLLVDPSDINSFPARLVLDRVWIFDLSGADLCLKY